MLTLAYAKWTQSISLSLALSSIKKVAASTCKRDKYSHEIYIMIYKELKRNTGNKRNIGKEESRRQHHLHKRMHTSTPTHPHGPTHPITYKE
jgi:hypothetical protein